MTEHGIYHIQNYMTMLAHDPVNGKIVAQILEPQLLEDPYRDIAEKLIGYWKKHKVNPGVHTGDLFQDVLLGKNKDRAKLYKDVLRNMQIIKDGINTEYVLTQLSRTHRIQEVKASLLDLATLTQQGPDKVDELNEKLSALANRREFKVTPPIRLNDIDRLLAFLEQHQMEFRTGIDLLDKERVVPARQECFLLLGPSGTGKSWWLSSIGKANLLQRKRVLHVTCEMRGELVQQRYLQGFFAIPTREKEIDYYNMLTDKFGYFHSFSQLRSRMPKMSFEHPKIRARLNRDLKSWVAKGLHERLMIAEFPDGALSIDMLRSTIDSYQAMFNFTPDMVVLDYIGITKLDPRDIRNSLGRNLKDFRALCKEYNCAGVTAAQTSRASEDAFLVDKTMIAEDWSLCMTADVAVTITRTKQERARQLARLWMAKVRNDSDTWGIVITQNYALGQFCLQAAMLGKPYYKFLTAETKRATGDDDEDKDED